MIARLLFALARQRWVGALVGLAFAHASSLLPVRRVRETRHVVAFDHPRPSWPGHMLLVPKRRLPTLLHLDDEALLDEIVQLAGDIVAGQQAVLCANGGARQEVGQLHFHLVPGEEWVTETVEPAPGTILWQQGGAMAARHPLPAWEVHVVLVGLRHASGRPAPGVLSHALTSVTRDLNLAKRGYTLLLQYGPTNPAPATFHLIAGGRLKETASS